MKNIKEILNERILIIDGAMGTMIQQYKLAESDYRGDISEVRRRSNGYQKESRASGTFRLFHFTEGPAL